MDPATRYRSRSHTTTLLRAESDPPVTSTKSIDPAIELDIARLLSLYVREFVERILRRADVLLSGWRHDRAEDPPNDHARTVGNLHVCSQVARFFLYLYTFSPRSAFSMRQFSKPSS